MASTIASNPVSDIARALMERFDTNKDNHLSGDEFTALLTNLLSGTRLSPSSGTSGSLASATATSSLDERLTKGLAEPPRSSMEGFNHDKIQARSHDTIKYKFARVAWLNDLSTVHTKADADALLNKMKPDLEASGVKVVSIKGDTITVQDDRLNGGKPFTMDVIRATGTAGQAWHWETRG